MPVLLQLVASDCTPEFRTRALQLAKLLLRSPAGVSALVGAHAANQDAAAQLMEAVRLLAPRPPLRAARPTHCAARETPHRCPGLVSRGR
jgi:hypothetical protein